MTPDLVAAAAGEAWLYPEASGRTCYIHTPGRHMSLDPENREGITFTDSFD